MTAAGEIFPQVFRMNLHLFHRLLFTYEIIHMRRYARVEIIFSLELQGKR